MTKLAGALPKGDANGMTVLARPLIESPHDVYVVIAYVDCKSTTTDNDTGEVVPTARIRRVEAVLGERDLDVIRAMVDRVTEDRTGMKALPFEGSEPTGDTFRVHSITGEVLND